MRGIGDIPQPDRAVQAAADKSVPIRAKRHRVHGAADGRGLGERAGVRGIGDIPQRDHSVVAAAAQRLCNGHEWAKRQAAAAGIGFTALSNGFASCEDPAALQAICDRFGPGTASRYGAITSALRSPALNRITGMPLACAQSLISRRSFAPIGSNSAGDTIGLPR